jgi:hypothetical protein
MAMVIICGTAKRIDLLLQWHLQSLASPFRIDLEPSNFREMRSIYIHALQGTACYVPPSFARVDWRSNLMLERALLKGVQCVGSFSWLRSAEGTSSRVAGPTAPSPGTSSRAHRALSWHESARLKPQTKHKAFFLIIIHGALARQQYTLLFPWR